jgi:hypothetical protein
MDKDKSPTNTEILKSQKDVFHVSCILFIYCKIIYKDIEGYLYK